MVVVAYGIGARIAKGAIKRLRDEGKKVGLIRPITLWPFPAQALQELAKTVSDFFVFEMSAGQLVEDVRLALEGKGHIHFYGRPGGVAPMPVELYRIIARHYAQAQAAGATGQTMKTVFERPSLLKDADFHYCPGCGHGIINRLLMEVIEEMDLQQDAICVAPAGCGMLLYNYFEIDVIESAHGRGAAVATGIKRVRPQNTVFSYQGDGDLAAIGTAEGLHAANRGENITVIFVNNGVYGMTGGQMAPTTILDQVTTTTPTGRDAATSPATPCASARSSPSSTARRTSSASRSTSPPRS